MQKKITFIALASTILFVMVVFAELAVAQGPADNPPQVATSVPGAGSSGDNGDDSNPKGPPQVIIPAQYRPTKQESAEAATNATTVYFTPQDENTSTTVLFLYNTNAVTSTVHLNTYYVNGTLSIKTAIRVPPHGLVRICADTVSTVSASWTNYVLVNFTTFSAYAKMKVPSGVKYDGYVAWDTSGVYDPLSSVQTLPLQFTSP